MAIVKASASTWRLALNELRDEGLVIDEGAGGGDKAAAQRFYRIEVKEASKRMSERDAWRYAALGANTMGFTPADVRADPETFEPLPEGS